MEADDLDYAGEEGSCVVTGEASVIREGTIITVGLASSSGLLVALDTLALALGQIAGCMTEEI